MRTAKQIRALAAPTTPITPKKRTPAEFIRVYGDPEYEAFTRAQPCACCGWEGATQICHARNGGTSRKADWEETFPGCGPHWAFAPMPSSLNGVGFALIVGCNTEPERIGRRTFEKRIGRTLLQLAAEHQAKYRAHVGACAGSPSRPREVANG